MKRLLDSTLILKDLINYINQNINLTGHQPDSSQKIIAPSPLLSNVLNTPQHHFQQEKAVRTIQRVWRGCKIKEKIEKSPYFSYVSLIHPQDDQRLLSSLMFGRRIAAFQKESNGSIDNPFISAQAKYHRTDNLDGDLLDSLMSAFNISLAHNKTFKYIPVTYLKNTPIEECIEKLGSLGQSISIIKSQHDDSLVLLQIPKQVYSSEIKSMISALGLIASPWEIASSIKQFPLEIKNLSIVMDSSLPRTKESLLQSHSIEKLNLIANNKRYATKKLAKALNKILQALPELRPEAIQRIALMLALTHTFYEHHYARYAFCIYAIIHEISLAMAIPQDKKTMDKAFNDFWDESENSLLQSLGLKKDELVNTIFFASPAMTGTNAYAISMKLANQMKLAKAAAPAIKMLQPAYYEFYYVTQQTHKKNADIWVISAGAIVTQKGLMPGVEINRFVKRNIIEQKLKNAVTIIVDATTALYKNLQLNEETKALVISGKLSIIIHESHQKFGLLHTDQAQYGRVFGLCSKDSFSKETLQTMQANAREDFNSHIDMRIGAFINTTCQDTLEEIKQQHFRNGAILRNILTHLSLVSKPIQSSDSLTDLNALYFVTSPRGRLDKVTYGLINSKSSFGHFSSVIVGIVDQIRISPDASDEVDCLIQAAQLFLAYHYKPEKLLAMLIENGQYKAPLSLAQQIITIAMINNVIIYRGTSINASVKNRIDRWLGFNGAINLCPLLKGRQYYVKAQQFLVKQRDALTNRLQPQEKRTFFEAISVLYEHKINRDKLLIESLVSNNQLCKIIIAQGKTLSNKAFLTLMALSGAIDRCDIFLPLLNNDEFLNGVLKIHSTNEEILLHLKSDSKKYLAATHHSRYYLKSCFTALYQFYRHDDRGIEEQTQLITALNQAKRTYCDKVLSKDRSFLSKMVRYLLKGIVNFFVVIFTFGYANRQHYGKTGHWAFFSRTFSENMLAQTHRDLESAYLNKDKQCGVYTLQN